MKKLAAILILSMLLLAVFPAASEAIQLRIDPLQGAKKIFGNLRHVLEWFQIVDWELNERGERVKPIYNEQYEKERRATFGFLFFIVFLILIYMAFQKRIEHKGRLFIFSTALALILAIPLASTFDLTVIYPFVKHTFFLMTFYGIYNLISMENLLGKHKFIALVLALVLTWFAFNSVGILIPAAPGVAEQIPTGPERIVGVQPTPTQQPTPAQPSAPVQPTQPAQQPCRGYLYYRDEIANFALTADRTQANSLLSEYQTRCMNEQNYQQNLVRLRTMVSGI